MSNGAIFINYRKQDSEWKTETLYKELLNHFDEDSIFKDFTTIQPGDDYKVVINNALNSCGVLLVIIGKDWLEVKDNSGKRRLDNPSDLVRFEIATALKRGIRVIPVLFDNVEMPPSESLPEDLQPLYDRHAISIERVNLKTDIERLAAVIKKTISQSTDEIVKTNSLKALPQELNEKKDPQVQKIKSFSKTDLIISICVTVVLLVTTILYFIKGVNSNEGTKKTLYPYLIVLFLGILSIVIQLGQKRIALKNLLIICLLLMVPVVFISIKMFYGLIESILIILVSLLTMFLIWKRKYILLQVIILLILLILSVLTINLYLGIYNPP